MSAPISVQLYSVRDALAADLPGTLSRLRGIGFERVEPFGFVNDPEGLADAIRGAGLTAPSGHCGIVEAEDADAVFAAATRIGIRSVIEPAVRDGWDDADGVRATARRLNELAVRASESGLEVGYHNHWWEFGQVDGGSAYELFVEQLAPEVVLEVDTYWASHAGVDVPALLGRLGDRVRYLHVKDGDLEGDGLNQAPAGQGRVDVDAILAAAPTATRVLEFDRYDRDLFTGLAEALRYVNETEVRA